MSERRLCFNYEQKQFRQRSAEHEANKAQWKKVMETIKTAPAYYNDNNLQKLVADEDFVSMIAAVVELPGDGTANWLPTAALRFAELYRAEFKNEKPVLTRLRGTATAEVGRFIGVIENEFTTLAEIQTRINKRSSIPLPKTGGINVDNSKDLPGLADIEAIFKALRPNASGNTERNLISAQHGLINLARALIGSKEISVQSFTKLFGSRNAQNVFVPTALQQQIAKSPNIGSKLQLDLEEIIKNNIQVAGLAGPNAAITQTDPPGAYKKVQDKLAAKIIEYGRLYLVGPTEDISLDQTRRKQLSDAKDEALRRATDLNKYEKKLIEGTDYAKTREEYLAWLRGNRINVAIYNSFTQTGKFDTQKMFDQLLQMNPSTTVNKAEIDALFTKAEFKKNAHLGNLTQIKEKLAEIDALRVTNMYAAITDDNILEAAFTLITGASTGSLPGTNVEIENLLKSVWNQEPLNKYLEEQGMNENYIANSASHIVFRSYIGKANADKMIGQGLGSVKTGMITGLTEKMFSGDTMASGINESGARKVMEYCTKQAGGGVVGLTVNKKRFIDAMHFVLMGDTDAKAKAEALWNDLAGADAAKPEIERSESDVLLSILLDKDAPESLTSLTSTAKMLSKKTFKLEEAKIKAGLGALAAPPANVSAIWTALNTAAGGGPNNILTEAAVEKAFTTETVTLDAGTSITDFLTAHAVVSTAIAVDKPELKATVELMALAGGKTAVETATLVTAVEAVLIGPPTIKIGPPDAYLLNSSLILKTILSTEHVPTTLPGSMGEILSLFATPVPLKPEEIVLDEDKFTTYVKLQLRGAPDSQKNANDLFDLLQPIGSNAQQKKVEQEVLKLIQGRALGKDSEAIVKHMHATGGPDKGLIESMADISIEAIGTAADGGSKWWEWMSSMPAYYLNADMGEQLLAIDDRRTALRDYSEMIDALLKSSESNGNVVKNAIDEIKTMQAAQDKASQPLDVASGALQNNEQAHILLQASKVVIDRLNEVGWSRQSQDVRYISYWIAMSTDGGIDGAVTFLNEYLNPPYKVISEYVEGIGMTKELYLEGMNEEDQKAFEAIALTDANKADFIKAYIRNRGLPFKQSIYLSNFINKHPTQTIELNNFLSRIDINEEQSDQHILDVVDNKHGIRVRPMAMQALMGLYQSENTKKIDGGTQKTATNRITSSMRVGRWLIDRGGNPQQQAAVREALNIVLEGSVGAKTALINTFMNREPDSYFTLPGNKGVEVTFSVTEADDIIARVQTHLTRVSSERQKAFEQLREEEFYSNPLERGLRAGIETLQDLWSGDMVDKAKVIAAVVAGIYIIRKILTEGGKDGASGFMKLAKWTVIGLPLLIVANSAIKNRTGRDYMGEMLQFLPKEERSGALERFRRRGKEEQRYAFLGTNAGHESLRQLSGPNTKVTVRQLLSWREQVQGSPTDKDVGHNVYSNGAPSGLNVSAIQSQMGPDAKKEDAYKLAYLSFEALLTDVATLRGNRGSVDQRAELGADIIRTHYVDFAAYRGDPEMQAQMKGRTITMMDVIISESQTPATLDAIAEDRTFVEWFADAMGWTYEEAQGQLLKLGTRAKLYWERTGELLPELWDNAWEAVEDGAENIYDFYRKVKPRALNELGESADALWRVLMNTAGAAGIIISKAPRAGEVVVKFAQDVSEWSIDTVIRIYDLARSHSTIGNLLNGIEHGAQKVFGANFASLLALRGAYQNDPEYVGLLSEFPRMAEGLRENLSAVCIMPGINDAEAFQNTTKGWVIHIAKEDFGIDISPDMSEFSALNKYERMAIFEKMKRKVHSLVVAERVTAIKAAYGTSNGLNNFKYPITITHPDWDGLGGSQSFPLADQVEETFGFNTLALIATEKDWAGAYQEWLDQNISGGITRPPLQFMHFLVDWATMDNQTEHLIGSIEQYKKMFMPEARKVFARQPDKLRAFESYLETITTNVALEAAMGARNGQESYGGPARFKKADVALLQEQATAFLQYLKTLRGFSADSRQLQNLDLSAFNSKAKASRNELNDLFKVNNETLLSIIQDRDPSNPKPRIKLKIQLPPLTQADKDKLKTFIGKEANISLTDIDVLLELLDRAQSDVERKPFREFFDKIAVAQKGKWENLDTDEELEFAFKMQTGVTEAKLKDIRKTFFDKFQTWANSGNLAGLEKFSSYRTLLRDGTTPRLITATTLGRIQDTIDRTVQGYIDDISDRTADSSAIEKQLDVNMKAAGIAAGYSIVNLKAMGTPKDRKQLFSTTLTSLASLYKSTILKKTAPAVTEPTLTSDAILLIMEHIIYVGDDTLADAEEGGRTGFDKFKNYMNRVHTITVPDKPKVEGLDTSAVRMTSDNEPHIDGPPGGQSYLEILLAGNGGLFGFKKGHINTMNDRLKGIQ